MIKNRAYKNNGRKIPDNFSGNLLLRIDPELHKEIFERAFEEGKSINLLLNELIEKGLKDE